MDKEAILRRIDSRLAKIIANEGKSEHAVCLDAGLGAGAIRDMRRKPILPRLDTLEALARPLRTTPEWLAYGAGLEEPGSLQTDLTEVPLVSWVAASSFAEVMQADGVGEWPNVKVGDLKPGRYMALKVEGDSMNRIAVHHSIIIIRMDDRNLIDRGFYVFQGNDGATFKRFRSTPPRLEPYSTNTVHETIYPTNDIYPIGRVVRVITDLL